MSFESDSHSIPNSNLKLTVKKFLAAYPECRDCDIKLTKKIWQYKKPFLSNQIHDICLAFDLKELPFPDSITRARRAVQKAEYDLRGDTWYERHSLADEFSKFVASGGF